MPLAKSKLTSQGQVSIPLKVRQILGLRPGAIIEWEEKDGQIVVCRAGSYTFADIRATLFPDGSPKHHTLDELKEGIKKYIRKRYARS